MNASAVNTINQVPLVNSTQILTTSAQVPQVSQVPITSVAASTPINPVVSQVPVVAPGVQPIQSVIPNQNYATQTTLNTLVDEDYRLGRGILDDFRPNAYKTQVGIVGNTTTNIITSSTLPVTSTPVVTSTVVPTTANVGNANVLKDFL